MHLRKCESKSNSRQSKKSRSTGSAPPATLNEPSTFDVKPREPLGTTRISKVLPQLSPQLLYHGICPSYPPFAISQVFAPVILFYSIRLFTAESLAFTYYIGDHNDELGKVIHSTYLSMENLQIYFDMGTLLVFLKKQKYTMERQLNW